MTTALVCYDEGKPYHFGAPDVFVALDCPPGPRLVFKTWEERRTPDVVFEITSRSSSREDSVFKSKTYEQLGAQERLIYNPTAEYLRPSLRGFRLAGGELRPFEQATGRITSEVLGLDLSSRDGRLVLVDSRSGEERLTRGEAEQRAREAERAGREAAEAE